MIFCVKELLSMRDGGIVQKCFITINPIHTKCCACISRLSPVLSVGFETHSPTCARKDLRQRNWQLQCGEREAVGGQAQTDEPYLSRACVSSPSTPACPGALAVCLSFSLDNTYTQEHVQTHTHTHRRTKRFKNTGTGCAQAQICTFAPSLLHTRS